MSNKPLKRTEAEFFVYEPGVVVPRDVTHLLVPSGVKVLPEGVFRGLQHLKDAVLPEGFQEIGRAAFSSCGSLERVSFPSTLVRIDDYAFFCCELLTTLDFSELVEIGIGAFYDCSSVKRISFPPTVTSICANAFSGCSSLETVILVDGIRTIGCYAFLECALEDLILPATLTQIDPQAFKSCRSLRGVKLCGGIQLIKRHAFQGCELLNHIVVTPNSVIVMNTEDEDIFDSEEDEDFNSEEGDDFVFDFSTNGTISSSSAYDRVVIASECFYSLSSAELSALQINMTEALQMHLGWDDTLERLRGLLTPHERRRKEEVVGLLKLGVREVEMRCSGEIGGGIDEESHLTCKADVIVENVVAFL